MSGPGLYAGAVRLISMAMIVIGAAICIRTLTLGGGPLSFGILVGLTLFAIGCARLWLAGKMGSR